MPNLMPSLPPPPLLIHVIWHPDCHLASRVADGIRDHFGTHRFRNVVGGPGIDVVFQQSLGSGTPIPVSVAGRAGSPIAIVAMIDSSFVEDSEWVAFLGRLGQRTATEGLSTQLLPVAMERGVLDSLALREQAIRWDAWDSGIEARQQQLMRELAYALARMLRRRLHLLRLPHADEPELEQYLQRIQTFLSYSKHDGHGKDIAETVRIWLDRNSALSSFLDVYDIPVGLPFPKVIDHHIGRSVVLAIQTDSYSSREWCRREVIEAKRKGVPMIVVDCLQTEDERAFPYIGNVPVVRMDPVLKDRLPEIAGRLLDEVLVDFLWRCRVAALRERPSDTIFMARPPELISLATLGGEQGVRRVVVYPDPPLDDEELRILRTTWSGLRIRTMAQWLAEGP